MIVAPPPSGEQFELLHRDQRAVVVSVGGGLRSYETAGRHHVDGYAAEAMCDAGRGQLLAPWPNRLRGGRYEHAGRWHQLPLTEPVLGNAIHGLVRWAEWRPVRAAAASCTLAHRLHPQPGYPYTVDLEVTYELDDKGLTVSLEAVNRGATDCPFGAGWHPYLRAAEATVDRTWVTIPAQLRLETDSAAIPVATVPVDAATDFRSARPVADSRLDTAFTGLVPEPDGRVWVRLRDGEHGAGTALWADRSCPFVMVYTGDTIGDPTRRRRSIAIEPMTCAPNAFASGDGLHILMPGERTTARWGIVALAPVR